MTREILVGAGQAFGLCLAVLPTMLVGCLAGSAFANSRFGLKCGALFMPLARLACLGRLREPIALYLALCFLSFHSANAYLASLLHRGIVQRRMILGIYLVGWLPASMHFYIFYTAPVLFPGFGAMTAGIVISLYVLASVLILLSGVVLTRMTARRYPESAASTTPGLPGEPLWPGWKTVLRTGLLQFRSIAGVFVPCIFAVQILLSLFPARALMEGVGDVLLLFGLPPAGALVTVTALPSVMGGFATAIACLNDGLLVHAQIPKVLMIAAIGHAFFSAFSYFLPANAAVFGPRFGTRITFSSLVVRVPSLVVALAVACCVAI